MSVHVKRYFAQTARECLRQVKEELGPDAVVLSNRSVNGGVEILALPPDAIAALQPPKPADAPPAPPAPAALADDEGEAFRVSLSSAQGKRPAANPPRFAPWQPQRVEGTRPGPAAEPRPAPVRAPQASAAPAPAAAPPAELALARAETARLAADLAAERARMTEELESIRSLIENQLAGFAWGEMSRSAPARTRVLSELLDSGFSAALARRLIDDVPEGAAHPDARNQVREALSRSLHTLSSDADLIDRGGVFALVGPTGVGKTTTTAKLAARCVVRHGADKLALITTDGYRIGAHEQLKIYGRILGVPVHVVRDAADLRQTLQDLRNKHMVLIDTMGMSQRDRQVAEQAAMLLAAGEVKRILLLNATARGDTLDDVVRAYAGPDLAGCIFSKVDEAASLAPAIDVAVRNDMDVLYVANGQRVPEDLHLPNRSYLLHRCLRELPATSPHRLQGDEAGLLLAGGASKGDAPEARIG